MPRTQATGVDSTAASGGVPTTTAALDAYLPGGSVYAEQVPMARTIALSGSVFDQQVPQAPASGLTGSLYDQQVPSAARQ